MPRDNGGEVRVASRKLGDARGESLGSQPQRHANLTIGARSL
jgi:hypothetical protein